MSQDELSGIFTVDLDQDTPCYDQELKVFNPRIIKAICSSLVVITETESGGQDSNASRTALLQLSHFTVKEFLLSTRLGSHRETSISRFMISEEVSHKTIALCCMAYLLEISKQAKADKSFAEYPLKKYALQYVQKHIAKSKEPPEIIKFGVYFVRSMAAFAVRKNHVRQ